MPDPRRPAGDGQDDPRAPRDRGVGPPPSRLSEPRPAPTAAREECDEIEAEIVSGDRDKAAAEVGDLLFAAVNLARHLDTDPEATLRAANQKFMRRFASIEQALAAVGKRPQDSTLAELDALWDAAKAEESKAAGK